MFYNFLTHIYMLLPDQYVISLIVEFHKQMIRMIGIF